MIDVTIKLMVPPAKRKEIMQTVLAILGPIRLEPGCLSCNCYVDVEAENSIFFKEEWQNQRGLECPSVVSAFRRAPWSDETTYHRTEYQI